MKKMFRFSKKFIFFIFSGVFVLSIASSIAYLLTQELIVAATSVTYESTQSYNIQNPVLDIYENFSISPNANFAVVSVGYAQSPSEQIVSNVVVDGLEATFGCRAIDSGLAMEIWYVVDFYPAAESIPVNVIWTDYISVGTINVTSFSGVDTVNPVRFSQCNDSGGYGSTNPNVTVSSNPGDVVFGAWNGFEFVSSQNSQPNTGTIDLWAGPNTTIFTQGGYRESTSSSEVLSWSFSGSSSPWAISAISIIPDSVVSNDVDVTLIDSGSTIQVSASTISGTASITGLSYRVDGGSWINLDSSGGGAFGTSSATSGAIEKSSLGAPGDHVVDFRALASDSLYYPQPTGYASQAVTVSGSGGGTSQNIQVLNVYTDTYAYSSNSFPINTNQPLDPDDNSNYALLFVAHRSHTGQYVVDATWGSSNFSQIASCGSDTYSVELWGLANPDVGLTSGDIQFFGSGTDVISSLVFLSNVDDLSPVYDFGCADTQNNSGLWSTTPSITLSSQDGYLMFGGTNAYFGFVGTGNENTGTTEIWERGNVNTLSTGGYRVSTGTSDTMAWTYTGSPTPWSIVAVVLQPGSGGVSSSDTIDISVNVDNAAGYFDVTASATGALTVSALEFSYDGGNTWVAIDDLSASLVSGGYGTTQVTYEVSNYSIPSAGTDEVGNIQYYPVKIRAIDSNSTIWPSTGFVEVSNIEGFDSSVDFNFTKFGDGIELSVLHGRGNNISTLEYRVDQGAWLSLPASQLGTAEVSWYFYNVDLPKGNHVLQVRIVDDTGITWPLQDLYNFAEISISQGLYENPKVLSDLDFNSNIGGSATNYLDSVLKNESVTQVLPSEQGYEYWLEVVDSSGGRAKISDTSFTNDSSMGALTFEGIGDDSVAEMIKVQTKSKVPQEYGDSQNIYLSFDFTWHDSFISTFESQEQAGNKLYLVDGPNLIEIYDFYANGNGNTGVTQQVTINLSQALANQGINTFTFSPEIVLQFESLFAREAQNLSGIEGYTIDNLKVFHSLDGTISNTSLPKLNFTSGNLFNSAKNLENYSGIQNNRLYIIGSDTINGVAVSQDNPISNVTLELYSDALSSTPSNTVPALPTDGSFDSFNEAFAIILDNANIYGNFGGATVSEYSYAKFVVTDQAGSTNYYDFNFDIGYIESDSVTLGVDSADRQTISNVEVYDVVFSLDRQVNGVDPLITFNANTDLKFSSCEISVDLGSNFSAGSVAHDTSGDACMFDFTVLPTDVYTAKLLIRFNLSPESYNQATINGLFTAKTLNGQEGLYDTTTEDPITSREFEPTFILNNLGSEPINENQVTYTGKAYGVPEYGVYVTSVQYAVYPFGGSNNEIDWTNALPSDGIFDEFEEDFYFQTPPLTDGEKIIFIRVFGSNGLEFYSGILGDIGAPADRINIDAVDTSAPIIELHPILPNPTVDTSPQISGSVGDDESELTSNIALIEYSLDGVNFEPISPADGIYDETEESFKFYLENLTPGDYQVWVRATDSSGNVTTGDQIKSLTFTVIEREDVQAVKVRKDSNFSSYLDFDPILSENIIWGRGQLRLKEKVSILNKQLLVPTNNGRWGNRYKRDSGSVLGFEYTECGNGVFLNQAGPYFAYYDFTNNTEYDFDLSFVGLPLSDFTQGLASYRTPSGECHLWLGTLDNKLVAINFGISIADGIDEYTVYDYSADASLYEVKFITIDARDPNNYGVMFGYSRAPRSGGSGGTKYIKPGASISSQTDDSVIDYFATPEYNFNDTQTVILSTSAKTYGWWFVDYHNGIVRYDDNGTPLDKSDDAVTTYSSSNDIRFAYNFALVFNKDDQVIFAGDHGVSMIYDFNGTFDASDDSVTTLASSYDLKQTELSGLSYFPGDDIIGEQIWLVGRGGEVIYLSTNNTPTERRDDVIEILDYASHIYPAQIGTFIQRDVDSFSIYTIDGIYDVTMNIDFEQQGTAVTKVYADLQGNYLDVDYIELISTAFRYTNGVTSFRVSNDGGFTWQPIQLGEKVNFANPGYRFVFAIDMFHGSTPVMTDYLLEYSAYPSEDQRGVVLGLDNEPDVVPSGEPFSFEVEVFDNLFNPLEDDQVVHLELRNFETNEIVNDFNIDSVLVPRGSGAVSILNAKANVLGTYYIYGTNGSEEANSDPIIFVENVQKENNVTVKPSLTFFANKYEIYEGEKVVLSWQANNFENLVLSSDNTIDNLSLGSVNLNDTLELNLTKTTTFTLKGTGAFGDIESSLVIKVVPRGQSVSDVCEVPEIRVFDVTTLGKRTDSVKVRISWDVVNVENVTITGLSEDKEMLSPKGDVEVYLDSDVVLKLVAKNNCGETNTTYDLDIQLKTNIDANAFIPLAFAALISVGGTMAFMPLSGTYILDVIQKFGILFGVVGRKKKKYWGFVYDSKTKSGIPFAVVNVYVGKTLVGHEVTDLDGKYALLLEKGGEYTIEVKASGYKTFKKRVHVRKIGPTVEIVNDIELKREGEKSWLNNFKNYYKPSLIKLILGLMFVSMAVGFVYTVVITTQYPNAVNYLLLSIYGILFTLNVINLATLYARTAGKVVDLKHSKGLAGVSVRFYRNNSQVGVYLTNSKGEIKVRLQPGKYWYIANKKGYVMADTSEKQIPLIEVDDRGYLVNDIKMKKKLNKPGSLAEIVEIKTLQNPFGAKENV
jgi:hypothetical protein